MEDPHKGHKITVEQVWDTSKGYLSSTIYCDDCKVWIKR